MSSNTETPKPTIVTKDKKPKRSWFTILIALLALAVAIAAIVLAWCSYTSTQKLNADATTWQNKQSQWQQQDERKQAAFENDIKQQLQKNSNNLNQLLKQTTNISAEQAISQAQYLINLAQLQLRFSADRNAALKLLTLSQSQLKNFNTPTAEALKQKLSNDIAQVQQIPPLNKAKVIAEIDQLILKVKHISLLPNLENRQATQTTASNKKSLGWWQSFENNLKKLKSFVTIRKVHDTSAFDLSPDNKLLLKQTIIFKLSQAQWALLNNQPEVYYQSLAAAKQLLPKLTSNAADLHTTTTTITQLEGVHFSKNIDINLSATPTNGVLH